MGLRVLHLSTYDTNGGAARAAYSLHCAMLKHGIDSRMLVGHKATQDPTVSQVDQGRFATARYLDRALWKLQRSLDTTWRSPARFGSLPVEQINQSGADVVNLHWVTDGFMSIETIGQITKPIVWSMYDMWPFTGTEHYTHDSPDARWRSGYTKDNRPSADTGLDLDRWTFNRKMHAWGTRNTPISMVPASTWLRDATQASLLMKDLPVFRIPHVVDTERFTPGSREAARRALNLPADVPILLFLASAGVRDERKGFDLLVQALPALTQQHPDAHLVIVGPVQPGEVPPQAIPIIWAGKAMNHEHLASLYSAADVTVVPSRVDNMPLTAMEAQTMGRAVVAFRIGGLPDIIEHGRTGLLADPANTEDLARCLIAALEHAKTLNLGESARLHAEKSWSSAVVVDQYRAVYNEEI